MEKNKISLELPHAVIELIKRMTPQEKQELSKLLNWKDLGQPKDANISSNGRRHGDPKFYIGTTPKGLNLEIPKAKINAVLKLLIKELSPENIEIFLSGPDDFSELKLLSEDFKKIIKQDSGYFSDLYALIEMDENEIISAGEGCISIALSSSFMPKRSAIATKILGTCGYSYQFKNDQFYAIVWDDDLEVEEK